MYLCIDWRANNRVPSQWDTSTVSIIERTFPGPIMCWCIYEPIPLWCEAIIRHSFDYAVSFRKVYLAISDFELIFALIRPHSSTWPTRFRDFFLVLIPIGSSISHVYPCHITGAIFHSLNLRVMIFSECQHKVNPIPVMTSKVNPNAFIKLRHLQFLNVYVLLRWHVKRFSR